ncbi:MULTISPECIES: phospholipase D-like domain-containing protein [Rhodococcus]|uniref:Phospholipase D-like domain-containing protein n=1 Tax=Rhodococcus oxybenzonivorans TaxID=1990687 RepID=A0AAE4UZA3_9NOCA|nr:MULTISPECIES: phospholipase D-like domain-containing protein [Rhodococcus]MDV7240717.1 phospholipase D-like domain-containing protein [Rhodococcus oxybenzonivorans]MDV7265830.1 phospholipase D-like domain-containing protein [Rhodococcus oxybenzonivorans]MDV7272990.1 phospholipase D-like domain-containing protein [Rhodococcus oxybenzonivorans]MDV7333271.1 phospholipase D-like domain-containing protein [Rhodococcus oxybenzonivorans]MDV7342438.1 phospholipase D-like domain-containing protein [
MSDESPILAPGDTCWQVTHADRLACIVDAADYFRHAKSAMLQARHRIILIGWDFDTRIKFEPDEKTLEGPNRLGRFLVWLTRKRPDLEIYLLKWNIGAFAAIGRGMTPVFMVNWVTDRRLHFEIDGAHPVGSAHHQKIVVIDDTLAFCGGIDMTVDRWDTSDHRDDNHYRTQPNGNRYGPWHDATTAVDGDAAKAVSEQARARWKTATGKELPALDDTAHTTPWPDGLEPTMHSVDVGIARTLPELADRGEVREIEALYLAAIAGAARSLYIESQYLASRTIAEAIATRLREPDGPEIILVLPRNADGWLERLAMDGARRRLLHLLWDADAGGKLGVYYPVTAGGNPIYVHAKILVMDDRLLRVGSSNLNNRSMGFDSECDLAVEVTADTANGDRLRDTIVGIRRQLLCEHLDVASDTFDDLLTEKGSLLATVEALRGDGRTLMPFEPDTVEGEDSPLAESELMDPERTPPSIWERTNWTRFRRRLVRRRKAAGSLQA